MGLWMCLNSRCYSPNGKVGFSFESDQPVCPKCEINKNDTELGHFIVERVTIHYDPPHPKVNGKGKGYISCDKTVKVFEVARRGQQASGEPIAVNCSKCKESDEWPKDWVEMDPSRVPDMILPSRG